MRAIYSLIRFKTLNKRPAVALGIFDGLHRGHQRIIARLIKEAKRFRTRSLVVTFSPHPQKENILYSLPHRLELLEELGIDICLIISFTPALRKMPAEEFLQKILINKINPRVVLIGRNFTFGRYAEGNWKTLEEYARRGKFELIVTDVLTYKGRPISSSWIRDLIRSGEFSQASELLGRPVKICGRVTRGSSLARRLGYPTANVDADHEVLPPFGVYSVRIKLAGSLFAGICYIGNKPTVSSSGITCIEVHIFDFKGNLYGRRIQIEFIKKIRPQKKFSSIGELNRQIKKDIRLCCVSGGKSPHP